MRPSDWMSEGKLLVVESKEASSPDFERVPASIIYPAPTSSSRLNVLGRSSSAQPLKPFSHLLLAEMASQIPTRRSRLVPPTASTGAPSAGPSSQPSPRTSRTPIALLPPHEIFFWLQQRLQYDPSASADDPKGRRLELKDIER
jgi:hypothetical protein